MRTEYILLENTDEVSCSRDFVLNKESAKYIEDEIFSSDDYCKEIGKFNTEEEALAALSEYKNWINLFPDNRLLHGYIYTVDKIVYEDDDDEYGESEQVAIQTEWENIKVLSENQISVLTEIRKLQKAMRHYEDSEDMENAKKIDALIQELDVDVEYEPLDTHYEDNDIYDDRIADYFDEIDRVYGERIFYIEHTF